QSSGCMSPLRCNRLVATCMAIAIAKAAMAGTIITTRNLRSIGRSANHRNNSPPPHRIGVDYDSPNCRLRGENLLKWHVIRFTLDGEPGVSLRSRPADPPGAALGSRADTAASAFPIEGGPRVGLPAGRNVAMPYHSVRGQSRGCITEGGHDVGERAVLGGFVVQRI